ncbi:MAG: DUF4388 domain-containing protein [Calditrichae bacterium]|nr:DUF4388 domain-containing protein [Calditrichota bacterium]MCB9058231.1 DUF4388 domain-containing protein [Calditrichia bacterium]
MSQYSIVVIDSEENRTDYFKNVFLKDDHEITVYKNIAEAISQVKDSQPTAFLVEYITLTAEKRPDVIRFFTDFTPYNIFIYNVPDNANKRLAFYELGAKRVFDTSQPLDEIFYALIWPLKNIKTETTKNMSISSGKLEDIPLKNLLSTLVREERTGILKIITENNSGKIYLRDGIIVHATVGLHDGVRALLHTLFWQTGNFSFHANASFDDVMTIHVSMVSILLLAEKLRQEYNQNLHNTGSSDAVVQIRYAGDLSASTIKISEGLKTLLMHPVVLKKVLENGDYTCYETAEKLAELKKYGFLSVTEPSKISEQIEDQELVIPDDPIDTCMFLTFDEAKRFDDNLDVPDNSDGNILLISTKGQGSYYFMRNLSGSSDDILNESDIYALRVEFLSETKYNFWGMSMSEVIFDKIEKLPKELSGLIFMVDIKEAGMYEYSGYVIRRLTDLYNLPWIVLLFNTTDELMILEIREKFRIPKHIPIYLYDVQKKADVKDALLSLKHYEAKEKKTEEVQIDKENNS